MPKTTFLTLLFILITTATNGSILRQKRDEKNESTSKPDPVCLIEGKILHVGEFGRRGQFEIKCNEFGYEITGCFFSDEQGLEHKLSVGENAESQKMKHSCKADKDDPKRILYTTEPIGCEFNNKFYKFGQTWNEPNGFKYECQKSSKRADIIACVTNTGDELQVNSGDIKNGMKRTCVRKGEMVHYEEIPEKNLGRNSVEASIDSNMQKNQLNTDKTTNQPSGNQVCNCFQNGATHEIGQTWTSGSFKFECKVDTCMEIIACLTDDGTEISIGSSIVQNGWQRKCVRQSNGEIQYLDQPKSTGFTTKSETTLAPISSGSMTSSSSGTTTTTTKSTSSSAMTTITSSGCKIDGVLHNVGETFVRRNFKMQCQQSGANIVACVTSEGSEIAVGETQNSTDGIRRSCLKEGNVIHFREHSSFEIDSTFFTTKFGASPTLATTESDANPTVSSSAQMGTGCVASGKKVDEQWIEKNMFRVVCKANGWTEILGCIANDGTEMKVGSVETKNGMRRSCSKSGEMVQYKEDPISLI